MGDSYIPPQIPLMPQIFDSGELLTAEQEVRLEVTKLLLSKHSQVQHVQRDAEKVVSYILEGAKDEPKPPKIAKRIPVHLPGNDDPTDAQAYILENGMIQIEFYQHTMLDELWEIIGEDRMVSLSFSYYPSRSIDSVKDNS